MTRLRTKRKFEKKNKLNYDHLNLNFLRLKHLLETMNENH